MNHQRTRRLWLICCLVLIALLFVTGSTYAATIEVTPLSPAGWDSPAGENSGGGSSMITSDVPRSGDGSLRMTGDRTRFELDMSASPVPLDEVTDFGYEWYVDGSSVATLHPDYTPALRLHIYDPVAVEAGELIWEGAYNGIYGSLTRDTWNTTDGMTDVLWRWISGGGGVDLDSGGAQKNLTVAQWVADLGSEVVVWKISVGVGSPAGGGYLAYADNVIFGANNAPDTYNFEPDPTCAGTLACYVDGATGSDSNSGLKL